MTCYRHCSSCSSLYKIGFRYVCIFGCMKAGCTMRTKTTIERIIKMQRNVKNVYNFVWYYQSNICLPIGVVLLAIRLLVVSDMAGRRRVALHRLHPQPVCDQSRPLLSNQSSIPVPQPHVTVSRQNARRGCLDPLLHHLPSATYHASRTEWKLRQLLF